MITVYRAAEEDPEDSAESLSWTIKREVAEFFMYEYDKRHARYLLEAKLDVADVIDYTDARNEAEVLRIWRRMTLESWTSLMNREGEHMARKNPKNQMLPVPSPAFFTSAYRPSSRSRRASR